MTTAHNATGNEVWVMVLYSSGWTSPHYSVPPGVEMRSYPRLDLAMKAWKKEIRYPQPKKLWYINLTTGQIDLLEQVVSED